MLIETRRITLPRRVATYGGECGQPPYGLFLSGRQDPNPAAAAAGSETQANRSIPLATGPRSRVSRVSVGGRRIGSCGGTGLVPWRTWSS